MAAGGEAEQGPQAGRRTWGMCVQQPIPLKSLSLRALGQSLWEPGNTGVGASRGQQATRQRPALGPGEWEGRLLIRWEVLHPPQALPEWCWQKTGQIQTCPCGPLTDASGFPVTLPRGKMGEKVCWGWTEHLPRNKAWWLKHGALSSDCLGF